MYICNPLCIVYTYVCVHNATIMPYTYKNICGVHKFCGFHGMHLIHVYYSTKLTYVVNPIALWLSTPHIPFNVYSLLIHIKLFVLCNAQHNNGSTCRPLFRYL